MKTIMDILTPSNIQFMIFTGAKYSLLLAIGAYSSVLFLELLVRL